MDDRTTGGSGAGTGGQRVGGRYEIGELLGRGGMAEVRRGTDIRLGRTVAIKRLRTDLATDPTFQARFRREAQAAAGLNHPNIVSVYDTGEEMAPDGTHVQPYIVMEYVAGRTLRDVLNDGRKLLPERALEITSGVLAALDYSHRAGIIHRDIKPANVMLTPSGDIKVMDFGIARAIADGTSSMTQTSAVVGTAQYLSPEQARGETVDSRSDVYSTGCLLYELLTGRPPFVGDSPFSVAYQHVREQADPPRVHNPELPPELDAIVMRSLAKKVDDRYQSAAEMRADIQRYLDGQPLDAPTVAAPVVAAAEPEPTSIFRPAADDTDDEPEEERRRRWPLVLLALLILALLAAAIYLGIQLFGGPKQSQVPQVTNMTLNAATARLAQEDLKIGEVDRVNSDSVPNGRIVSQSPSPGSTVDSGSTVDVKVSSGSRKSVVPYVVGLTRDEADQKLQEADLEAEFRQVDSDQPRGTVVLQDPDPGTSVASGSTVTVSVSNGPVTVPNVVGLQQGQAESKLKKAGFAVNIEYDEQTPSEAGTVLRQDPEGLTKAPRGSTVTITVSNYQPSSSPATPTETPTDTPSVTPTQSPSGQQSPDGIGGTVGSSP